MLVSKKLLHLLFLLKKIKKIKKILSFYLFYTQIKSSLLYIIGLYSLSRVVIKKIIPFYLYIFKIKLSNSLLLNTTIFEIFEFLKAVNLNLYCQWSFIKSWKEKYTVLRSPFVYKKTKEQFCFENYISSFFFQLGIINVIFIEYLDLNFKKLLKYSESFKLFIQKIIYLRDEI